MFTLPSGKVIFPNSENKEIPADFCLVDQRWKHPHLTARAVLNNNAQDNDIRCVVSTTPTPSGFRASVEFGYLSSTKFAESKKLAINDACEDLITLLKNNFQYLLDE